MQYRVDIICGWSLSGRAIAVPNPLITPFSGTNFRVGLTQIWVDVDYGQIKSLYQIALLRRNGTKFWDQHISAVANTIDLEERN